MLALTESQLDNVLMAQKDEILANVQAVYNESDAELIFERLRYAIVSLALVKRLWTELGYGYKLKEICNGAQKAIDHHAARWERHPAKLENCERMRKMFDGI